MSSELNVIQRTQRIYVSRSSGKVTVENSGPQGPAGPPGSSPYIAQPEPPLDTSFLWLDTDDETNPFNDYATLDSPTFTGNVIVPDANADGEPIAYDQIGAALQGLNLTGTWPALKLLASDSGNVMFGGEDGVARLGLSRFSDGTFVVTQYSNTGVYLRHAMIITEAGAVNFSLATQVDVPNPTAANQAAQVTAIDNMTGRLAIGGKEIGDTGRRNVDSLLLNGYSAGGALVLRRTGNVVNLQGRVIAPGGQAIFIQMPSGFGLMHPSAINAFSVIDPYTHAAHRCYVNEQDQFQLYDLSAADSLADFNLTWTTTNPWPTALPGVAL